MQRCKRNWLHNLPQPTHYKALWNFQITEFHNVGQGKFSIAPLFQGEAIVRKIYCDICKLEQRWTKSSCHLKIWSPHIKLTFITLWADSADDKLISLLVFPRKKGLDISCKLSYGNNLHEMSKPIFSGKEGKIFHNVNCWNFLPSMLSNSTNKLNCFGDETTNSFYTLYFSIKT